MLYLNGSSAIIQTCTSVFFHQMSIVPDHESRLDILDVVLVPVLIGIAVA